jgi:hypothetical protein
MPSSGGDFSKVEAIAPFFIFLLGLIWQRRLLTPEQ